MNVIVSACLLGIRCRYDGGSKFSKDVIEFLKRKGFTPIPVCPEQLGGCSTPRKKCEIAGDGFGVLKGESRVYAEDGEDMTEYFVKGAKETLRIAKLVDAKMAIMKSLSPSCGAGKIYDGSFSGKIKEGWGVTAALLKINGIKVVSERDIASLE
jgi:uncharacterized protein YbbK (DUF523 family)